MIGTSLIGQNLGNIIHDAQRALDPPLVINIITGSSF